MELWNLIILLKKRSIKRLLAHYVLECIWKFGWNSCHPKNFEKDLRSRIGYAHMTHHSRSWIYVQHILYHANIMYCAYYFMYKLIIAQTMSWLKILDLISRFKIEFWNVHVELCWTCKTMSLMKFSRFNCTSRRSTCVVLWQTKKCQ
jgi:hypothetical protein